MRGWRALVVLLTLSAASSAMAAWALTAYLVPILFPEAEVLSGGAREWLVGLFVAGAVVGVGAGFAIDSSPSWTDRLPFLASAGSAASLAGTALGMIVAAVCVAASGHASLLPVLVPLVVALVVAAFAYRRGRIAVREVQERSRERARLTALHATGTRVRADVVRVHFHNSWWGGSPLFSVTAEYDTPSGRRQATGRVVTSPAGAPIVGGTVLLWFAGDGGDVENIDIEQDPDSLRAAESAATYEAPTV